MINPTLVPPQPVAIYRGEPAELNFTVTPTGNIAGWTIVFTIAQFPNRMPPKTYTEEAVILDAVAGTFRVLLAADDTDLEPRQYYWDTWRIDPGEERMLAWGPFDISPVVRLPKGSPA